MPCICHQPVRPEFKDSYKDLLDKPKINGVPIDGDVNTDNLHIEYPHLANLPQINGVPLNGNLSAADLGIKAGAQFKIVPQLPVTDIDEATIYLVPVQVGQTDNIYQEWIYINNKWEKIGEPINIEPSGGMVSFCPPVTLDITQYTQERSTLDSLDDLRHLFYLNYNSDIEFPFKDDTLYVCLFCVGVAGIYTDTITFQAFTPGDPISLDVNHWGNIMPGTFSIPPNSTNCYSGKFILIKNSKVFFESTSTLMP